jgi:hypothetical protein
MKGTIIGFKRVESIGEWKYLHDKALEVVEFLREVWPLESMIITRIDSPHVNGESGVHHTRPCRAFDVRTWGVDNLRCEKIAAKVNTRFQYDPDRPQMKVAIYHKTDGGAYHLHLQIHPRTRPRLILQETPTPRSA